MRAWFENLLPDSKDIRDRMARVAERAPPMLSTCCPKLAATAQARWQIPPERAKRRGFRRHRSVTGGSHDRGSGGRPAATTTPGTGTRGEDADLRISTIAGAQEKTALLQIDGQWYLPHGATPTTHIPEAASRSDWGMKLDMRRSIENEWLCAQILAACGLPLRPASPSASKT